MIMNNMEENQNLIKNKYTLKNDISREKLELKKYNSLKLEFEKNINIIENKEVLNEIVLIIEKIINYKSKCEKIIAKVNKVQNKQNLKSLENIINSINFNLNEEYKISNKLIIEKCDFLNITLTEYKSLNLKKLNNAYEDLLLQRKLEEINKEISLLEYSILEKSKSLEALEYNVKQKTK